MNIYFFIIVITVLLGFILDIIADILNLKNLKSELPHEFDGIYTADSYSKSQEYTKVRTKFGFLVSSFSLIVMLIFWFAGGFNFLDGIVRNWFENSIYRGIAFIGILVFANSIISLPFGIYSTFVIEEKFGFNKTTAKTFILDLLKSTGLSVLIGIPVLALLLYILESSGDNAWLIGWGTVTLIGLIIQYIAPTVIMPIFNKFKPLEDGELRTEILTIAEKAKFSLKKVFVMDGSKRSSKSNAFFTGFGKNKRIALYDTLIEKHTVRELMGILAHEIGHYKKKHILTGMIISFFHTGLIFFLMSLFLKERSLFDAFFMDNVSLYAGLLFFGMLYSPAEELLSVLMNIMSRKHEFEADRFAVEITKEPEEMVNALKKLSEHNLSNLTPHPFYVFINYSHPPVLERIEAIRRIEVLEN